MSNDEKSVVALCKGDEKYIFIFDEQSRPATIKQFAKFATNTELSFNWFDAAKCCQKVRELAE